MHVDSSCPLSTAVVYRHPTPLVHTHPGFFTLCSLCSLYLTDVHQLLSPGLSPLSALSPPVSSSSGACVPSGPQASLEIISVQFSEPGTWLGTVQVLRPETGEGGLVPMTFSFDGRWANSGFFWTPRLRETSSVAVVTLSRLLQIPVGHLTARASVSTVG